MANLLELDPILLPLAKQFLILCNAHFTTHITVTHRSSEAQNQCNLEGLSNAVAGQSPHNCTMADGTPGARAFDWAIFDDQEYVKDGTDPRYTQAGLIAEGLGLEWGGRWKHPDWDHAQLKNWRTFPSNWPI